MTTVVQRLLPEFPVVRAAPAAFVQRTTARLRAVTPLRVGREAFAIAVIAFLDVFPGWLVEGPRMVRGWEALGIAAVFAALYLGRLCFPALTLLIGGYLITVIDHGGVALTLMLAYSAGYRIVSWQRALLVAALGLAGHVLTWELNSPGLEGPFGSFVMLTVFGMLIALPFLVGRYVAQRNALVAALQEREQRMRHEQSMVSRQVRLRERNRIAQDMHDSLGHRLSLISVHAGALALDNDLGESQREAVQVLRTAALTAMEELRGVIGVLRRDQQQDEDPVRRSVESVDELVEGARRAGVRVSLVRGGLPCPLPVKVGHAAYRVAQEGLTNANKHAPGASVQITVKYEPDALVVEVRNNPPRGGRDDRGTGVGLIGLGERVRLAGGMLHVGELPSGGFRIAAVLPYEDTAVVEEPDDDLPEPGSEDPSRSTRVRKWAGVGSIVLAGVVVLVVVAGYTWVGTQRITKVVDRQYYDSVYVGQSEVEVRAKLVDGAEPPIGNPKAGAAPEPAGATCVYRVADEQTYTAHAQLIMRFCFADGKVVEKNTHLQES